jgi:hypothetical protein
MPMNEPKPSPTWDEYLRSASDHLRAARRAAERGAPPPAAPERPEGPIPVDREDAALRLAAGYDLLAEEVVRRMHLIDQRRPSPTRLNRQPERRPAWFIDTPA